MSSKELLPSPIDDIAITPPSSIKRTINKPMIVDISIGEDGRQIYKVHESKNSKKRKSDVDHTSTGKKATPHRSILGTISPSSMNKSGRGASCSDDSGNSSKVNGSPASKNEPDGNVWSEAVEVAFEEALKIIPKNGLSKIKISGKSCGRNQLISDYIFQKTGKIRTRKQVSSHIQVIKNLSKNPKLVELISNGPTDPASQAVFDEAFSEISFKKSLGNTFLPSSESATPEQLFRSTPKGKMTDSSPASIHKRPSTPLNFQNVEFSLKRFEMSNINFDSPLKSHIYTKYSQSGLEKTLRLKPDAKIDNRFPNLKSYMIDEYRCQNQDENIPIIHNLAQLRLPKLKQKLQGTHETILDLDLKNVPAGDEEFCCMTIIYSFGKEVMKLVEDVKVVKKSVSSPNSKSYTIQLKFAKDFWCAFFDSMEKNLKNTEEKSESQKTIAMKAVTMQQVIISKKSSSNFTKDDFRGILLWEFTRADDDNFETSSRRLYLPNVKKESSDFLSKLSNPATLKEYQLDSDHKSNPDSVYKIEEQPPIRFTAENDGINEPPVSQPLTTNSPLVFEMSGDIQSQNVPYPFKRVQTEPVNALWSVQTNFEGYREPISSGFQSSSTSSSNSDEFNGYTFTGLNTQILDPGFIGPDAGHKMSTSHMNVANSENVYNTW